jgi:Na+/H+ antiporter NhaA
MAIFFLLVGVEIKHEWNCTARWPPPQARVLPFGAALGGMAAARAHLCQPSTASHTAQPGRLGHSGRHRHRLCASA